MGEGSGVGPVPANGNKQTEGIQRCPSFDFQIVTGPQSFFQCNGNLVENQIVVILGPVVLNIGPGVVIVGGPRICICFVYLVFYRGAGAPPLQCALVLKAI
ncbi:hypothetical protein ES703_87969 [subsurface metagenome]